MSGSDIPNDDGRRPDDPSWVDDIVERARRRSMEAAAEEPAASPPPRPTPPHDSPGRAAAPLPRRADLGASPSAEAPGAQSGSGPTSRQPAARPVVPPSTLRPEPATGALAPRPSSGAPATGALASTSPAGAAPPSRPAPTPTPESAVPPLQARPSQQPMPPTERPSRPAARPAGPPATGAPAGRPAGPPTAGAGGASRVPGGAPGAAGPSRSPRPDGAASPRPANRADVPAAVAAAERSRGGELLDDEIDDDEATLSSTDRLRLAVEWAAVIVGAFVVALLIKSFLLQPFYIPSSSMEPTLRPQDRVLVNKLSYDLHEVNRGDIIVFERPPNEPSQDIEDLIKRVIALPNETIQGTVDGHILIDGHLLEEPYLPEGTQSTNIGWVQGCANPPTETDRCTIPPGYVWVMGDNRDSSRDSRFFGPVSEDLIVGRAFLRVWPPSQIDFL